MTTLVIASGNAGKVREFAQLLEGLGLDTQPQPEGIEVEETGDTFAANASLKAEVERLRKAGDAVAEAVGDPTIDWPPREAAWNAAKDGKPSA